MYAQTMLRRNSILDIAAIQASTRPAAFDLDRAPMVDSDFAPTLHALPLLPIIARKRPATSHPCVCMLAIANGNLLDPDHNGQPSLRRQRHPSGQGVVTGWLHEQRLEAVRDVIRDRKARSVLDLGCGDGDLLLRIALERGVERVVGIDICARSLARLRTRLDAGEPTHCHVEVLNASLLDAPHRLRGFDCAVLVETIEHLDAEHLGAFERAVLGRLRPRTVVVTTPNAEFNALLGVPVHRFRHADHRFEWDRPRFRRWAKGAAERHGYQVRCSDIAGRHPKLGGASQMAVFDLPEPDHDRRTAGSVDDPLDIGESGRQLSLPRIDGLE